MSSSSLKTLAIRGTAWTLLGYGTSQALRLSSNLVLTRLLFPEVFGLSALVNTFIIGLSLFSDIGIGPSIIQNDKGEDPSFLNTAWTIQVIRGLCLWVCACIGAWPFATFYNEPQLAWLIPVSGLTALISGFNSTALFTFNRRMLLGKLTIIDLSSQIITIIVMIIWAKISPSVWALVAGNLVGTILKMSASHFFLNGIPARFTWNREAVKALTTFGRWIFVSTSLGFFVGYADRLILGKFVSLSELGVYSIAAMLAQFIQQVYDQLNNKILFPIYSKLKHLPLKEFRARVKKVRIILMICLLPPLWGVIIFSQEIINILFDSRYKQAGWMLQILALGYVTSISSAIGPFYLAFGNSFLFMNLLAAKAFFLLASMSIGGLLNGITGLLWGIAATPLLYYPIQISVYKKYSLWIYWLDFLGFSLSGAVIGIGLLLKKSLL